MPRPPRIEYEGAFHHVMNRGRDHRAIFHNDTYFNAFLETLQEVCQRFDAVIHAYCLMTNHYHLLPGLGHTGSALYAINKIRHEFGSSKWKKEVKKMGKFLYIVK
ncbi:transposase IS200 like protein [bacterium BMS3Bbin11]|nr:transposase IS200 like protein [bacterium BMS3Abin11]GBE44978.1 transposase IS200 like protein [bacterium BMS3Bbin11]